MPGTSSRPRVCPDASATGYPPPLPALRASTDQNPVSAHPHRPRWEPVRARHLAQPLQPRPQGDLPPGLRPLMVARVVRGTVAGGGPPPSPHPLRRTARPALRLSPDSPAWQAVAAPDPPGAISVPDLPKDARGAEACLPPPDRPAGTIPGHCSRPALRTSAGPDSR